MDERGIVVKTEKILLGLTALFLFVLLGLYLRDRAVLSAEQVVVQAETPVPQEAFLPDTALLDINAAAAEELAELPGIGAVLAQRIVDYRAEHGPFSTAEELLAVSGIGERKLAGLEGRITVGGTPDS